MSRTGCGRRWNSGEAVGLPTTKDMQGIDLFDDKAVKARKTIYGECFTHNAVDLQVPATSLRWRWAIEDHWKLILPAKQNEPDAPIELYDLKTDRAEQHDLSASMPDKVKELEQVWQRQTDRFTELALKTTPASKGTGAPKRKAGNNPE